MQTNTAPHCRLHDLKFVQPPQWYDSPVGPYTPTVEWASGETTAGCRLAVGGNAIFMPVLFIFYGTSMMKYTGRHENDYTAYG